MEQSEEKYAALAEKLGTKPRVLAIIHGSKTSIEEIKRELHDARHRVVKMGLWETWFALCTTQKEFLYLLSNVDHAEKPKYFDRWFLQQPVATYTETQLLELIDRAPYNCTTHQKLLHLLLQLETQKSAATG